MGSCVTQQKAPALQWYPGDWQRDTALRSCSLAARGLWVEMLNVMHDGAPRGTMRAGDRRLDSPDVISRMAGASPSEDVAALLAELESAGVYSREPDGTIYSRRMVRDTKLQEVRREAGSKGGATTQQKLREYVAAKEEATPAAPAKAQRPRAAAVNLTTLAEAKSAGLAAIRSFVHLHADVKAEAVADVRNAERVNEIDACVAAARQLHLRGEIEARAPQSTAGAASAS